MKCSFFVPKGQFPFDLLSLRGLVLLVAVLLCSGCLADRPTPGSRSERLEMLISNGPKTLDPRYTIDTKSMNISRLVFNNLVSVDNQELVPKLDLARSITVDPADKHSWIATLKPGVRWHDGRPLTADDVVYTFQSVMNPALDSPYGNHYKKKIRRVEKIDRLRVRFVLFRPYATFITDLVMGIVPRHVLQKSGGRFPVGVYVGTGPFRFHSSDPGRKWVLERNALYHGTKPAYRFLVFRAIADENVRLLALLGNSGDIVQNDVNPLLLDVLKKRPGLKVLSRPSIAYTYLLCNMRHRLLARPEVRRALAFAIDRRWIIDNKLKGYAELASGMLAPFHWAYNGAVKRYSYDPKEARRLLDKAGLTRKGNRPRFRLRLKSSNNRLRRMVINDIAYQLGKVGIQVETVSLELGTFLHDVRNGNYELAVLQQPEPVEPDLYHWMFYSLNTPIRAPGRGSKYARQDRRFFNPGLFQRRSPWTRTALRQGLKAWFTVFWGQKVLRPRGNRTFYSSSRVDELLDLGRYTMDRNKRKIYYAEIQRILALDLPFISLWHERNVAVVAKNVKNFVMIPNARYTPLIYTRKEKRP